MAKTGVCVFVWRSLWPDDGHAEGSGFVWWNDEKAIEPLTGRGREPEILRIDHEEDMVWRGGDLEVVLKSRS